MANIITVGDYNVSLRKPLGRGSFGTVFPAVHKDGSKVAAKQIDSPKDKTTQQELAAYQQHTHLGHENVVRIFDVCHEQTEDLDEVWIMMELCDHGHLGQYFNKYPKKFDDITIKLDMMCQIASGLEYLHGKDIVHGDIKPNNILVTTSQAKDIAKIGDFGLAKYLDPNDSSSEMNSDDETKNFKAPEFFNRTPDGKVEYHKNVDIFSAGLTFLSMIQPNHGGRLFPKAEDPLLNDYELMAPIGQIMSNRIIQNKTQLRIVVEHSDHGHIANMIRRVIYRATTAIPTWRLSASQLLPYLTKIKSNPYREILENGMYTTNPLTQYLNIPFSSNGSLMDSPFIHQIHPIMTHGRQEHFINGIQRAVPYTV